MPQWLPGVAISESCAAVKTGPEEIEVLNKSFNQMVEKIGNLVEDIHTGRRS